MILEKAINQHHHDVVVAAGKSGDELNQDNLLVALFEDKRPIGL